MTIYAVGLGKPHHAAHYCDKLAPGITCHVDNQKDVYATYGLGQAGLSSLLNPKLGLAAARAAARGHVQGKATGDVKMLPGTFVVDQNGRIQYAYYSSHAGDHPDLTAIAAQFMTNPV